MGLDKHTIDGYIRRMIKTVYILGYLREHITVTHGLKGDAWDIPVSWHPGMIGAFGVFNTEAEANAAAAETGCAPNVVEVVVDVPTRQ